MRLLPILAVLVAFSCASIEAAFVPKIREIKIDVPVPKSAAPCNCTETGECTCGAKCLCHPKLKRATDDKLAAALKAFTDRLDKMDEAAKATQAKLTAPANPPPAAKLAVADAAPTPTAEVVRVLALLPKPAVGFVDFGCGYDARWCIAAAEKYGCKVTGVEIDPARAKAARERVKNLGLDHLITIIEGDATTAEVQGDVAVVYLYSDLLGRLKPRLEKFAAVASYMHAVPGLPMQQDGNTFVYRRQQAAALTVQPMRQQAVWNGARYVAPVCNSPGCQMCQSIRYQLGY
jgi:hypothetical protein